MKQLVAASGAPAPAGYFHSRASVEQATSTFVDHGRAEPLHHLAAEFERAKRRWREVEDWQGGFAVAEVARRLDDLNAARSRYELHTRVVHDDSGTADIPSMRSADYASGVWESSPSDNSVDRAEAGQRPGGGAAATGDGIQAPAVQDSQVPVGTHGSGTSLTPPRRGCTPPRVDEAETQGVDIDSLRLKADAELFQRLAAARFEGAAYDRFITRLAAYGYQVFGQWIRSRQIFQHCAKRRIQGLPSMPTAWTEEDIEDLIQDTVARAIADFERKALREGRWRPEGGASLATYFIGGGLFAFRSTYQRRYASWQDDIKIQAITAAHRPVDLPDIADDVTDKAAMLEFLKCSTSDPKLQRVLYLKIEGLTHAEIAADLGDGTSARAVEAMLYRYRTQLTRRLEVNDEQ